MKLSAKIITEINFNTHNSNIYDYQSTIYTPAQSEQQE